MPTLTKLGKYEIRRELGKGGMGIVYEGFDPLIQRSVAIKTVLMSMADKSEAREVFSRFRREAQAAGRLSHPRIVSIYEYSEDHDMAFIAMELIEGKELKDFFDEKVHFQIKESINIILQLLDALDYSHSQGVIHRDIKPANIFITSNKQVKVADFGIAKIESLHLTQIGSVLGTPNYMSPEQFQGLNVDRRSDLYSAGVILYQLLTAQRPFTGSMITIMHKVLNQAPIPPSAHNPAVSTALDEVVIRAMAKQPEQRFQSASEFIAALKLAMKDAGTTIERTDPDATLIVPLGKEGTGNEDETLLLTDTERTLVLPRELASQTAMQTEIESWKRIKGSANPDDFLQYLRDHPHGEFAELAKLRHTALTKASIAETKAQTANVAARNKELANHSLRESRLAALKAKAVELKAEAEQAKRLEDARRRKAAEEQAHRAQKLSGLMEERTKKISEIMTTRQAEAEAKSKLETEARNRLAARIRRKTNAEK